MIITCSLIVKLVDIILKCGVTFEHYIDCLRLPIFGIYITLNLVLLNMTHL